MGQLKSHTRAKRTVRQVAVLAVRRRDDGLEVCLIRRKDSGKWGIPKGFIDRGDTPEQAALNEALEEAGLKGEVRGTAIGTYDYTKWGSGLSVAVYLMDVVEEHEHWREERVRERSWHSVESAAALLARHPVVQIWDRARESLAAHWRV